MYIIYAYHTLLSHWGFGSFKVNQYLRERTQSWVSFILFLLQCKRIVHYFAIYYTYIYYILYLVKQNCAIDGKKNAVWSRTPHTHMIDGTDTSQPRISCAKVAYACRFLLAAFQRVLKKAQMSTEQKCTSTRLHIYINTWDWRASFSFFLLWCAYFFKLFDKMCWCTSCECQYISIYIYLLYCIHT